MTPAAPQRSLLARGLLLATTLVVVGLVGLAFLRAPALAVVASAGLCVLALAVRHTDSAIYAVLFLLYSNLPAVGVTFHGVPKPLAAAFPLLLALPLLRDLYSRRQRLILSPVLLLLFLFFCVQAIGAALSIDPQKSFASVATFAVEGLALYLLVTNVLRSRETLRGATWALVAAGVLMSAVPLFQQVTGTFESNYGGLAQVDGLGFQTGEAAEEGGGEERQVRLAGPIGEKNRYAQVMLVLIPLALSCVFRAQWGRWKLMALFGTASIALGFVLAFSRGGALGMLCMVGVALGLRLIDARKALFVAGGTVLVLVAMPQYWKRLETIATTVQLFDEDAGTAAADGAVRRRVTEMMAAVRVFLDHPVIGVGPGLFKAYSEEYGNQDALRRIEGGRRAHSLVLEIAAETGAVGLGLFLAALLVTFVSLVGTRRANLERDPELADLATAYLLALVCYCSTGLFLHLAYMRYFYLVLALGSAAAQVGYSSQRARLTRESIDMAVRPRAALAAGGAP